MPGDERRHHLEGREARRDRDQQQRDRHGRRDARAIAHDAAQPQPAAERSEAGAQLQQERIERHGGHLIGGLRIVGESGGLARPWACVAPEASPRCRPPAPGAGAAASGAWAPPAAPRASVRMMPRTTNAAAIWGQTVSRGNPNVGSACCWGDVVGERWCRRAVADDHRLDGRHRFRTPTSALSTHGPAGVVIDTERGRHARPAERAVVGAVGAEERRAGDLGHVVAGVGVVAARSGGADEVHAAHERVEPQQRHGRLAGPLDRHEPGLGLRGLGREHLPELVDRGAAERDAQHHDERQHGRGLGAPGERGDEQADGAHAERGREQQRVRPHDVLRPHAAEHEHDGHQRHRREDEQEHVRQRGRPACR